MLVISFEEEKILQLLDLSLFHQSYAVSRDGGEIQHAA